VKHSWIIVLPAALLLGGCIEHRVKTEPIEVKPIHITVDVNVRVKVDKELDEFFDFQDTSTPDEGIGVPAEPVDPPAN